MTETHRADEGRADPSSETHRPSPYHGIALTRIAGIEIRADVSVLVLAALVAFHLAAGVFPAWHPAWSPAFAWFLAAVAAALLFASILAHELAHALVAKHYGLPVRRIVLFVFGGMAETRREPDRPKVELLVAAGGPALSLAVGAVATLFGSFVAVHELGVAPNPSNLHRLGPVSTLLLWLGPVNLMLALFNLVPGFPLDGGRVLRAVVWWRTRRLDTATRWATRAGQAVGGLLVLAGVTMMFGYRLPALGAGFVAGLWLVLIGWLLYAAAVKSLEQLFVERSLAGVPVARIMYPEIGGVPPALPVEDLERLFLHTDQRCFPVIDDGRLAGLVCLEDVRRVPPGDARKLPASSIMTPIEALAAVTPRESAREAFRLLADRDVDQLPVVDRGQLLGVVRRRDLFRWIALGTNRRNAATT